MTQKEGPFDFSEHELRTLGHKVVDHIVEHFGSLETRPVSRLDRWEDVQRELRVPFPEEGQDLDLLLSQTFEQIFSRSMLSNHPRFLGFIPSPGNPVSVFVEALVAAYNPFMGAWHEAAGPTMVELNVLDWLGGLIGFPEGCGGQVTSGGTAANLIGLVAARHHKLGDHPPESARVYLQPHTHRTILRNLRLLGFDSAQICELEGDGQGRMDPGSLITQIGRDRKVGLHPFCCVATAGTTNIGAVDPLDRLADICQKEGLWLHVDAAFGGASLLTREGKELLRGIERADTVVIDGHKWLFQPFEMGCIVARDSESLKAAFQMEADYTDDLESEIKLSDYGLQLSRSFKALKLWFSLRLLGQKAFREAVENGLESARTWQRLLDQEDDWTVVTPASLGVVSFRHKRLHDEGHRKLVKACWGSGKLVISSTVLQDRVTLRACPIHPSLDRKRLGSILSDLNEIARSVTE
ncbi:MAG: pyridoxal-dependent decarboxylase [Vulcanimicrobiota bacterium]